MAEAPIAVLCDYDDTTAVENVAELILERFGTDGWRDLRQ
jgi:2-hydroxy-3-keto-5-methylthiopentenyl-1-phosphate phosphatase